jgi:hypothetical protein
MIAMALLVAPSLAAARSVRDEPYPLESTWNAAVRLVRVDMGCTITERDRDLGYFTFEYREGSRTVPGSVEIVRTEVDGRQGTRVIVQVPLMPTYVESMLLTRLTRKLHEEYGEPVAPPPRRPAEEPRRPGEDSARPGEPRPGDAPSAPSAPGNSPSAAPESPRPGDRGSR